MVAIDDAGQSVVIHDRFWVDNTPGEQQVSAPAAEAILPGIDDDVPQTIPLIALGLSSLLLLVWLAMWTISALRSRRQV